MQKKSTSITYRVMKMRKKVREKKRKRYGKR